MIWLIMGLFVLLALLYVAQPLYTKKPPAQEADSEVKDYLGRIADIDIRLANADKVDDVSALELAKVDLQRQVLAKTKSDKDTGPQALLINILFIAFAFAAMGLYTTLGRPELTKTAALQKPIMTPAQSMVRTTQPDSEDTMSLEEAVAELEKKLAQDDQNPKGWMLYARSLMSMRRFDDALSAYEKVLLLTNNNPNALEEYESAKAYIAQQRGENISTASTPPGPSAAQMRDAAAMTPQARQEMIKSMVAGLSAKLADNPHDPDGWVRLLRARKVLGEQAVASAEIALMKATYKDDPAMIQKILSDAAWLDKAPEQ
ncbi:MAG: c-type cytochrome biogenesis protein CcmI [Robiginitomaculum sp.]|nr:c-type cytochrome biogenesis protein CcmI [Robiginitomaculum sp.]